MSKLMFNPEKDIKELEKYGFKKKYENCYEYIRKIKDIPVYRVYTTLRHKYIQIEILEPSKIAGSLQVLLYDLIKEGLVVKE